ncbi:MAG TPA: helix-turn-helix transcriptional regulator [Alphaproteobacteria bacterium]|nr:helix-turn-helix transcriptional regulator [Alphaproteobacteria bacterium]
MYKTQSLTAKQIKAARALLDWSQEDLAASSGLSVATIRKLEIGFISPRGSTTDLLRQAFGNAGLEFVEPGGVRHKPDDIMIYQGIDGACAFFDDVYHTAKNKRSDVVLACPAADRYFTDLIGDYRNTHMDRMNAIKDFARVRCILTENKEFMPAAAYCEYRGISKHYIDSVPFYVYDDKYAVIILEAEPSPKIVVLRSHTVAEAFRHQFYSMWDKATPLNKVDRNINEKKLLRA